MGVMLVRRPPSDRVNQSPAGNSLVRNGEDVNSFTLCSFRKRAKLSKDSEDFQKIALFLSRCHFRMHVKSYPRSGGRVSCSTELFG